MDKRASRSAMMYAINISIVRTTPTKREKQPHREQDASRKFDGGDECGGEDGSREAKAGKEESDAAEIVELAPAILCELEPPINPHEQQEEGLQGTGTADT